MNTYILKTYGNFQYHFDIKKSVESISVCKSGQNDPIFIEITLTLIFAFTFIHYTHTKKMCNCNNFVFHILLKNQNIHQHIL